MKLYIESNDDENLEDEENLTLPNIKV